MSFLSSPSTGGIGIFPCWNLWASPGETALELSISSPISYLDILALSWDKLWQLEDTQASCKQIDTATAVFQYEIIRPQKCNSCIINQTLRSRVVLQFICENGHTDYGTEPDGSVRTVQTVNPQASPSQQANDMALSEHLRNWQTSKGRIGFTEWSAEGNYGME